MIYCVEDDQSIRDLMLYTLNAAGFAASGFPDSVPFWDAMKQETPELILLDIMLPGEDGISILKELKASPITRNIPVIMATAKDSEYDKVIGLDLGADDYLSKPFGMMEMVSRIKAVLRRTTPKEEAVVLMQGGITMNTVKHQVSVNDKPVTLTLKEYELLRTFMENVGKAFSREQLLSSIWGIDFVGETRTVDVHIGTLRTKLGSCGSLITTVRGVGYRMEDYSE
ncbi:MAG: response regulator transcription factor [Eubacteriales bacterium]|nr:response regulator transcription factor [Eubacteriales bacterium]